MHMQNRFVNCTTTCPNTIPFYPEGLFLERSTHLTFCPFSVISIGLRSRGETATCLYRSSGSKHAAEKASHKLRKQTIYLMFINSNNLMLFTILIKSWLLLLLRHSCFCSLWKYFYITHTHHGTVGDRLSSCPHWLRATWSQV